MHSFDEKVAFHLKSWFNQNETNSIGEEQTTLSLSAGRLDVNLIKLISIDTEPIDKSETWDRGR